MPNWVYNGLTIEGPKEDIFKLVEQVGKPFTTFVHEMTDNGMKAIDYTYEKPIFSFWNIIAPTDLDAYKAEADREDLAKALKTSDNWYYWNNRNWGVKWDVAKSEDGYRDTYMEGPVQNDGTHPEDPWVVYYNFDTPWGVADSALIELSRQYPKLLLTLGFEEETGWGGEWEFLRGEIISRADWEEKCVECDKTDCLEYCEECGTTYCLECDWSDDIVECKETHSKELTSAE